MKLRVSFTRQTGTPAGADNKRPTAGKIEQDTGSGRLHPPKKNRAINGSAGFLIKTEITDKTAGAFWVVRAEP